MYTNHPDAIKVCLAAFPEYHGKKFQVEPAATVDVRTDNYWSGGTKATYRFIRLDTLAILPLPTQSAFDKPIRDGESVPLAPGLACVQHHYFCGKDLGCTIMLHPDNMPAMISAPAEDLSPDERIVLRNSCAYKSSYAGISNYRFYEAHRTTGITLERWNAAKENLIAKRLLNKAGAVTIEGRNADTNARGKA
jgi:hypothetical protein